MIFTLEMILDELTDLSPISNHKNPKNQDIQGMFYFSSATDHFRKDSICVCSADALADWKNQEASVIFFITNTDAFAISHVKNYCYIFKKADTVTAIANRYMQLMADYSYWDKEMHLAIINSSSLDKMLDYGSRIIDFPIQVYDPSFRILETSQHHQAEISDFQSASALGYTPPDFITKIRQANLMPRLQKSQRAIAAPAISVPEHTNIYRAHMINGHLLGYSCIFCGDFKITPGYLDKAELFLQNLDFYFKENQKHLVMSKHMYESFLISLLSSRQSIDSKQLADRARIVHLPLRAEFVLVQLNFNEKEHFLHYLCNLIQKYLPEHSVFIYEGNLYLLITQKTSGRSADHNAKRILGHLQEMMPSYTFSCYVSNAFFELTAIYDACLLCSKLEAMQLQFALEPGIYAYADWHLPLHFLQYGEAYDAQTLCMPELYKMKRYDKEYKTHYLDTLNTYFENNCDLKKTGSAMNMHRNSIANRMDKIQQLFDLDLSDFKTLCSIYASLQLLIYWENK